MNNIWSKNKYVEIGINILIYLMSMNFLHYGQLLLPVICLVLFIDRKFHFYVNNIRIFIVLCLFGLSFAIFSYKLGFYCFMGFCLPMSYYIGSNMESINEKNIKKVVYIILFGMVTHYLLNFIYEIFRFGWYRTITKATRYDIWLQDKFVPTGTATNAVILLSISYYLLVYENSKKERVLLVLLLILTILYTIILRRRIQIGILIFSFFVSMIIDTFIFRKRNYGTIKKVFVFILLLIIILIILYINNSSFKHWIDVSSLMAYLKNNGLESGRFDIFVSGIKYMPIYLFGGQKISSVVGMPFHDLLFDIYDYAGIVTMILMTIYLILVAKNIISVIKTNKISNSFKLLVVNISIGFTIMFFLEPLMTGSSLFMIVGVLIEACIELLV